MLVDTHAHIYLDMFVDDLDEVLARAQDSGINRILMPAIDIPSIHRALELSAVFDGLYAMAALHPSETKNAAEADFQAVADLCDHPNVVAVGETGLDYYWDRSFDEKQREYLRRHIRLAIAKDLPIVFHNREAFEDLISVLEEERSASETPEKLRGIFHCFTGTVTEAERVRQLGFLVGIGGIVTFKNSKLDEAVREIPLDQIVFETDAPYLAPEPHRGERNEPAFVRFVAEQVAAIKGVPIDELARQSTENARRLFQLPL